MEMGVARAYLHKETAEADLGLLLEMGGEKKFSLEEIEVVETLKRRGRGGRPRSDDEDQVSGEDWRHPITSTLQDEE